MRYRQYIYLGGSGDHSRVRPASAPYGIHSIFGTLVAGVEENVRVKFQVSMCNGRAVTEDSVGSRTRSRTLLISSRRRTPDPCACPFSGICGKPFWRLFAGPPCLDAVWHPLHIWHAGSWRRGECRCEISGL